MSEDPSAERPPIPSAERSPIPPAPPIPPYDPAATPAREDARTRDDRPANAEDASLAEVEREEAVQRLRKKRDFRTHLTVYALVMSVLVAIWLLSGGLGSYFWPIWPMLGWGLGVAIHGATLFSEQEPTEEQIQAEAARMRARRRGGAIEG